MLKLRINIYSVVCCNEEVKHKRTFLSFYLTSNCFILENTIYKQITGTAMGSSTSVRIAKIVMQFLVRKIISFLGSKICFWRGYVDDVFLIAEQEDLNEF